MPAASVAVDLKVVVESSETATVSPGELNEAAVPEAAAGPEQSLVVYSLTVEPASAAPEILGELSFAGEPGLEASELGAAGALESSTNMTELDEQPLMLPAESVAVAVKVVVESSETATVSPGELNEAVVPEAATEPEQSLVE